MKAIKRPVPTPISGLALAIASLGLCWDQVMHMGGVIQVSASVIAAILLSLVVMKFIREPALLREEIAHPVIGSVMPTFAMATMVVSVSLGKVSPFAQLALWSLGVSLHVMVLSGFLFHRMPRLSWEEMVPSWFVPPVGIAVAALTCPQVSTHFAAQICLTLAMAAYTAMLPVMIWRLCKGPKIARHARPTVAIMAAPASLVLAAYLNLTAEPTAWVVMGLAGLALVMTTLVVLAFMHLLRLPFSPGYAAYTFPMVISATAMFKVTQWLGHAHPDWAHWVNRIAWGELMVATAVVGYVAYHYWKHLTEIPELTEV
uniref:TDT family transporter n=1 Tax=Thaumasiovibrio occultus TaxID=1891184 RepID=UPI000B35EB50|nr:TDT family transporter [Thaumasiovibrio occultus]